MSEPGEYSVEGRTVTWRVPAPPPLPEPYVWGLPATAAVQPDLAPFIEALRCDIRLLADAHATPVYSLTTDEAGTVGISVVPRSASGDGDAS